MDTKVNFTIIGIIGFLLIGAFIFMVFWMTAMDSSVKYDHYVSYFSEGVTGLERESLVRLNGITVGHISKIKFDPKNYKDVVIYMKVKHGTPVTVATTSEIESAGLTGGKFIALKSNKKQAQLLKPKPGEKWTLIPSQLSLIDDLESSLKEVTAEMKQTIQSLNILLGPKNRKSIQQSLTHIDTITRTIANNANRIDASLASMENILKNTSAASKQFPAMIKQTRETLASFQDTAQSLGQTGYAAKQTLAKTNTTIQNFSDQLMPNAEQLLSRLNQMMGSFTTLSDEISRNPSILIRGTEPPEPGPGEGPAKGGN
ncbi:MAG: MlaD family protein [Coxiellaceae bacterium]|nr:MlaD family protein [Coxiellaceae bacterium]